MTAASTVSEAVTTRRSTRAFTAQPVDEAIVRRVLQRAARAPSGGNLQPWHIYAIAGEPLARLCTLMERRVGEVPKGEPTEYDIYPKDLTQPYLDRRFAVGEAMYARLGIPREDRAARRQWFNRNFRFFDAPLGLFCFVHRTMGPPQWSDLGMYLQTVMLLLREEGLDSCPQECWALYPQTVAEFVGAPSDQMLFCGMAVGHADRSAPVNSFSGARAALNEFATFIGMSPVTDERHGTAD